MFELVNDTPFAAERSVQMNASGRQFWVVVVKATYELDERSARLAKEQEPVSVAPKYLGKEGQSSLLREMEMTYAHPGTDVIVNAVAYPSWGDPVRQLDATVSVGELKKTIRVLGDRQWIEFGGELVATPPVPFASMPICYERAYGGALDDGSAYEERNPIGRGFGLRREDLRDRALPNIEDPAAPIQRFQDRPAPAGLGAVPGHWLPRRPLAGTFDEKWRREQAPLYPNDFDPRFFAAAATGLHSPVCLRGGERVRLEALSQKGVLEFSIPREVITIRTKIGRSTVLRPVQLDRVIIEPEDARVVTVWRVSEPVGPRFREVEQSFITFKPRLA